ncbi:HipA family kinase [Prosthecobacter sp.]|uniref:HipA family kinase n=1 Tax=Prosthecobacter sp. TaxID=1965333 RepID=UPI003784FD58
MVRKLQFIGFIEPAKRGITKPLIIQAKGADGVRETVFLKTLAGYADRPEAAGVELFTTLIAQRLGLRAPEPVLVEVPTKAGRLVYDAPAHAELLNQSAGLNFGTVALGNDWKVWLPELSTRSFPEEMVERVLAFDALIQHTDRSRDNPNLMWKGQVLAVLDHEKVFGYLKLSDGEAQPWRRFFQARTVARHVLYSAGRRLAHPDFGKQLWESVLELELEGGFDECHQSAVAAFSSSKVDLARIRAYLSTLAANAGDFFDYLKASLQT